MMQQIKSDHYALSEAFYILFIIFCIISIQIHTKSRQEDVLVTSLYKKRPYTHTLLDFRLIIRIL